MSTASKPLSDTKIIDSWKNNVRPWIAAIQNNAIASRTEVTNQAILDTVLQCKPKSALDIGCGEGWLVRALVDSNIDSLGTDVVPEFIEWAQAQNSGRFKVLAYEDFSATTLGEKFDVAICNFSLLGKESVEELFKIIPSILHDNGTFIVQTLHPSSSCGDEPYQDGWRKGSWAGFSDDFRDPAPWYFRTLETWHKLFTDNGFTLSDVLEPKQDLNSTPNSVIFVATH